MTHLTLLPSAIQDDINEITRAHDFDSANAPYQPEVLHFARAAERLAAYVTTHHNPDTALARIAALGLPECITPNVWAGIAHCPCNYGGSWPCPTTKAAWLARGVTDLAAEARRLMGPPPDDEWI